MTAPLTCWRCEQPGHTAAECQREAAETEAEVRERIRRYMDLRIAGRISTAWKRKWVEQEWTAFHEKKEKARGK